MSEIGDVSNMDLDEQQNIDDGNEGSGTNIVLAYVEIAVGLLFMCIGIVGGCFLLCGGLICFCLPPILLILCFFGICWCCCCGLFGFGNLVVGAYLGYFQSLLNMLLNPEDN